jgi:hypothetical protein
VGGTDFWGCWCQNHLLLTMMIPFLKIFKLTDTGLGCHHWTTQQWVQYCLIIHVNFCHIRMRVYAKSWSKVLVWPLHIVCWCWLCLLSACQHHDEVFQKHNRNSGLTFCIMLCLKL